MFLAVSLMGVFFWCCCTWIVNSPFLWWRMRLDWHRVAVYDCARFAGVAQLVEQRIRNAQVMGSSPFTGSRHSPSFFSPPFGGVFLCLASRSVSVVCRCSYFRCLPHYCSRSKSAELRIEGRQIARRDGETDVGEGR